MKKTYRSLSIVLSLIILLSMVACGKDNSKSADTITVKLSVDCTNAVEAGNETAIAISDNGVILEESEVTIKKDATAYDLIMDSDLTVSTQSTSFGVYVQSIESLAELSVDGQGGWVYLVNDEMPEVGIDAYELKPGDHIRFVYSVTFEDF